MDNTDPNSAIHATSIYNIAVKAIGGGFTTLSEYSGKVLLIVNELVEIEHDYSEQGVQILAFPCNQFGKQEPGTDEEVLAFVRAKGANFPVFSKIDVNGDEACELYKFLRARSSLAGENIRWNFAKFLVNRDGSIIEHQGPEISPLATLQSIRRFL